MDVIKVMETFPTQEHCIDYLERLRWQGAPECPHCESIEVRRRNEQETGRIGRWNCHNCHATFKVTHGNPLFHGEPKNSTSTVVSRDRAHDKRKEKSIEPPACARHRSAPKNKLAYDDEDTCRDGKGYRHATRDH